MSSPEFQVAFGVKGDDVFTSLKEAGLSLNKYEDEIYLVDEGIFKGMYSGNGECPEWLGLELEILDNYSPFIDMIDISYQDNEFKRVEHHVAFHAEVKKLKTWLAGKGYTVEGELKLPEPSYFIACGTA
ncbi:hypothetical protein VP193E371_P0204 [Vibrio phage 193E37-1]|nr:hypothetical protein VP193E371_P0204 [Vibrio phage 193E37-1]